MASRLLSGSDARTAPEVGITLPDSPPSARATALVKLYPFGGPTIDRAAQAPGLAHRTAERGWLFARAWLFGHFAPSLVTRPRPDCP